ncbi:ribonuclease domain-containing protein [Spirosoma rhododendri]|uniref:Ribonuclease n=1 Tax=Spirosoma rhododendri TaxID=2728024 RepID=A0A7L5DPK2_9BACT|nr:ribonuclease domain-containing protein [Spirosoma rhododendri]QJD77957.1 ribonuclease [Spirosoma rhododendri]
MKPYLIPTFYRFTLFLCLLFSTVACRGNEQQQTQQTATNVQQQPTQREHRHHRHSERTADNQTNPPTNNTAAVPDYVQTVLTYVRQNRRAPQGYVGGRTFGNFEKLLPIQNSAGLRLRYQEWDVKPKVQGQNRGAERLITSSDDHAYYTRDHYRSFTEIK